MKRTKGIVAACLLVGAVLFAFNSCGGGNTPNNPPGTEQGGGNQNSPSDGTGNSDSNSDSDSNSNGGNGSGETSTGGNNQGGEATGGGSSDSSDESSSQGGQSTEENSSSSDSGNSNNSTDTDSNNGDSGSQGNTSQGGNSDGDSGVGESGSTEGSGEGENTSTEGGSGSNTSSGEILANASENAKKLYKFICDNYKDGKTISGQMDLTWDTSVDMAARVYNDTRKYPALMGYDFMNYTSLGWTDNSTQTEEAIAWAKGTYGYNSSYTGHKGGIVAFCWHWRDPLWDGSGSAGEYAPDKITFRIPYNKASDKLDESTDSFRAIKEDLDVVAAELKRLKDEEIPVLWRPLHEGAGNRYAQGGYADWEVAWFWWGAGTDTGNKTDCDKAYIALWRYMHDYFTNEKGLDNLIWVWNGQATQFYPGDDYVDIIGWDVYGNWNDAKTAYILKDENLDKAYNTLAGLNSGKPIALTENGTIPADLSRWAYFMVWNDGNKDEDNFWSNPQMNPNKVSVYQSANVITLEDLNW